MREYEEAEAEVAAKKETGRGMVLGGEGSREEGVEMSPLAMMLVEMDERVENEGVVRRWMAGLPEVVTEYERMELAVVVEVSGDKG